MPVEKKDVIKEDYHIQDQKHAINQQLVDIIKFRQLKSGMKLMNDINKSDDKIPIIRLIIQKERSNVTCALGAYGTIHNVIIENNI